MSDLRIDASNSSGLSTPVVLLLFNRPDLTARVFAAVREARPRQLLVVADGPRTAHPDDQAKCAAARAAVLDHIDWPCEAATNFSDTNLGCRHRVVSGLTWAFEQVERAVILEDDCLPDPTFFRFCEQLLDTYADDARIAQISGTNYLVRHDPLNASYFYSIRGGVWGWATWRRAWRLADMSASQWRWIRARRLLHRLYPDAILRDLYRGLDAIAAGQLDSWDYLWALTRLAHGMVSVVPSVNLVSNIGFGASATHTFSFHDPFANLPTIPMEFPLRDPGCLIPDARYDLSAARIRSGSRIRRYIRRARSWFA